MLQSKEKDNHEQLKEQGNHCILEHFELERDHYMVQGINDSHGMSNFDCEWIDHEESMESNHHYGMDHVEFNIQNDMSINNEGKFNKSISYQIHDESCISTESNVRGQNSNILGDDLELLNNFEDMDISRDGFEKHSNHHHKNLFDEQSHLISQIQIHHNLLSTQTNQQEQNEGNQHNQKEYTGGTQISNSGENKSIIQINDAQRRQASISKNVEETSHSRSSTQKENTVVINQNSFLSRIYEDLTSADHSKFFKSMMHYIQTNQTSYKPYYTILQTLFTNSKIESDKSIDNFNMYGDFFKQKTKQIEKFLKQAQSPKTQKFFQNLKTKEINNLVYVDTKIVLGDIHERNIKKVKLYRVFYKQIQQISIDFKKVISQGTIFVNQVYQRRRNLEKQITICLFSIKSLQNELQKMIEYRFNYERLKSNPQFNIAAKQLFKVQNPHVLKDQYLQIRVIIEKQSFYISKLKQLRVEIIKYITLVFLTDDILVSAKIKENLVNYTQLLIEVQKIQKPNQQVSNEMNQIDCPKIEILHKKKNLLNQKKIHQELKAQLTKRLCECIPQDLKAQIGICQLDHGLTSEKILQNINSYFQNEMFLPSIQLDSQFIFYSSVGSWTSRDEYREIQESKMNSKQEVDCIQKTDIQLRLILTVNKYLHMEQDEKIATLKLNEIKIAQKGKYLIISDKGKGIVGYLVNNGNELGRIKFKSVKQSNEFVQKLRQLIQQK